MDKKCEKKLKKTHFCERCNFTSKNKTDYDRHCKTQKHIYGLDNLDNKHHTHIYYVSHHKMCKILDL